MTTCVNISSLPPINPITGSAQIPASSGGTTYSVTASVLANYVASTISGSSGGASGISGYSGYSGAAGSAGASGVSGYSGAAGSAGASGVSGYSGAAGSAGASGVSGYSGAAGSAGASGVSGYSGSAGASGVSGYSGALSDAKVVGLTTIILNSVAGPAANWTANYTATGGKLLVTAYASAFVSGVGSYTWELRKNGATVATNTMYWNATSTHIPLNPISYIDTSGSTSANTWSIVLPAGMTADSGDDATITVLETTGVSIYLLEAYANVTYTLPGSFTEDACRYSVVSNTVNVSSSWFDTSTYTFTPQKAGYWEITASYDVYRNAEASMVIKKNGSIVASAGSFNSVAQQITKIVYLNGSTDYIQIFNYGGAALSRSQYAERSWFQARWVGE